MFVLNKIIYFKKNQSKLLFLSLFGGKIAKLNKKTLSIFKYTHINFYIYILSVQGMLHVLYRPNTQVPSSNVIMSLSGHSFVIEV